MNAQQTVPAFVLKWVTLVLLGLCLPLVSNAKGQLQKRIEVLEQQMAAVIAANVALQEANVALREANAALQAKFACVSDDSNMDDFIFRGCNVHVRNGEGSTDTINGFGNLIVGYDEPGNFSYVCLPRPPEYNYQCSRICSNGAYDNQEDCESAGEEWASNQKTGSHNLVVGSGHNYTRHGGFVAGVENAINRDNAVVSGGTHNLASGPASNISGGIENIASGFASSVSGGIVNLASGPASSVSGGEHNEASGFASSVSGGLDNTASNYQSSVLGGIHNEASGLQSSILGGSREQATGDYQTIPPIP